MTENSDCSIESLEIAPSQIYSATSENKGSLIITSGTSEIIYGPTSLSLKPGEISTAPVG